VVLLDESTKRIQNARFVTNSVREISEFTQAKLMKDLIGFTDVIVDRYYGGLFNHAQIVMFQFDLESPLVAQK
jgi:hypothetical protein